MRVLVAGADRVDAGKTTFSTGLIARLGATGFKPRAGNDHWFDHDDYREAVAEGRLYGKDARRLAGASDGGVTVEEINPIHRLWRPDPGTGNGLVGRAGRQFVCDRVAGSYVVNAGADVPASARENLPVEDAVRVSTVDELNDVTQRRHLPALRAVAGRVQRANPAVVESYGDIARPLQGVVEGDDAETLYDAVAVVQPGRTRVYDGRRYVRATEVASASPRDGTLERRVPDVVKHIDPLATVDLDPMGKDEQRSPDAVGSAYREAYDAVVDAARE